MEKVSTVDALRESVRALPRPLALVPTMGAIHDGHMALVRRAREQNASTAVSIFVNPAQFGPGEDFARYPRDLHADLALLREAGVDLVFTPSAQQVYPPGFDRWVDPGALATRLEGASRPGHFRGVCTVVLKLFNLFRPDRAYFGEKDGQQLLVVGAMARDLDTGVEIVRVPTVRAGDGLALSSRNARLSPPERHAATVLWRALSLARRQFNDGVRDASSICRQMEECIAAEPLAATDYVSIADAATLDELDSIDRPALVSLAVRIGATRLIDNIRLPGEANNAP